MFRDDDNFTIWFQESNNLGIIKTDGYPGRLFRGTYLYHSFWHLNKFPYNIYHVMSARFVMGNRRCRVWKDWNIGVKACGMELR